MRDVGDAFLSWLEWFRICGFSHLFLYFDDPARDDASIQAAVATYSGSFLSIVLRCPAYEAEWPHLASWPSFQEFTDDRMCRQLLNIAHCIQRAAAAPGSPEAVDWLLHLDHDELFLPPFCGIQEHFRRLEAGGCRLCLYENYEAIPSKGHSLTPFIDIETFKVPAGRVPKTPGGAKTLQFWARRTKAGNYFLYYDNGKSAVRIQHGHAFAPQSVHVLVGAGGEQELADSGAAWTTFPEAELKELNVAWMMHQTEEAICGAKVLHYPATHYERLFRKYDHLKDFPSKRFGGNLILPPSFHLEARDCYVAHLDAGPDVQRQHLKQLLEDAAFLSKEELQEQFQNGSVVHIDTVRKSLMLGSFLPPRQLREELVQRLQRCPTAECMDRLRALPRKDAELLLVANGGLLKQLEAGLDAIAKGLEDVGWAACPLGAHPAMLAKALQEAEQLQGRMQPGMTVILNEVIDQSLPNAKRGDKIMFLEEHSLGGQHGKTSPAPSLALLERAMSDLGFKLDARLQRSSLSLRITERCDSMLACYDGQGASYGPHIDNADGDGREDGRILTIVLYLNPSWEREHGGALAIFQPEAGSAGSWHEVWPESGTLVFFRADRILHEVRPSYRSRFAMSLWFCGRRIELPG